jgi:hypothetical protein
MGYKNHASEKDKKDLLLPFPRDNFDQLVCFCGVDFSQLSSTDLGGVEIAHLN